VSASARPGDWSACIATPSPATGGRPGRTRRPSTTSWSPFPPRTREVQFDEKWAFVAKKEKRCDPDDPADDRRGDCWDHVALDPDHRLVVAVIPGKRTAENAEALVREFYRRTSGRPMALITTDEYAPYREAILRAYGVMITPPRTGKRGRPRKPYRVAPASLLYATVPKTRRKGRVVRIEPRLVFGTGAALKAALAHSASSRAVNTSFVERQNGTDRNRNARKIRKAYSFSKLWEVHELITYFTLYSYTFCWPVRTLADIDDAGRLCRRTPAMAAGLTDHVWSLGEWLTLPAVHRK
jgi:IS1 family transposase